MIMSNENQYLRPDYLTPLPSLDAKNSPLALLAQTCSQIGADAQMQPNGKANSDKSNGGGHHHKKPSSMSSMSSSDHAGGRDKRSPSLSSSSSSSCSNGGSPPSRPSVTNHNARPTVSVATTARSSFKPYESCVVRPAAAAAEVATAISLDATIRRTTAPVNGAGDRCSSKESASSRKSPADDGATGRKAQHEQPHKPPSVSPSAASMAALMAAAGYPSPHHPAAHHLSHMPSHHHHMAALSSPLMGPYFRAGAAAAVAPSLPCRDPYCGGCQLAAHLQTAGGKSQQPPAVSPPAATTCPAGCTQCDNTASSAAKTSAANVTAAHHHHPSTMSAHHQHQQQHHNTMAAAYAHAQLAALAAAASQLPYVCSWMGADLPSYCGKRFGTSDELLQHLRTHTADPAAALPLLQRSYPTPPLSPSAAAAAAAAAANRYHPYAAAAAAAAAAKHHPPPYGFPSGYPSSPLALSHHPGFLPPYFPAVAYSPYAAAAAAAASPRLGTSPHT